MGGESGHAIAVPLRAATNFHLAMSIAIGPSIGGMTRQDDITPSIGGRSVFHSPLGLTGYLVVA